MYAIKATQLIGAYVALITPMTVNGDIDYGHLEVLIESMIGTGINGLVVCGTTGQAATLSSLEHLHVAKFVTDRVAGRCQVIVASGSNCTQEAINLSNGIEDILGGAVTMLHVTGYYNLPTQEGLLQHFLKVADSLRFKESNIILYNVPGRTVCSLSPETIIKLAEHPRVIGLKEVLSVEQVACVAKNTNPNKFRVLSGEDDLVAAMMAEGAFGTISGSANLAPRLFAELCQYGLVGDFKRANELQEKLMPLIKYVFSVRNPIPLAHAFRTYLRLPLCRMEGVDSLYSKMMDYYKPEELNTILS
jgi:4-hydroxy-tetrahydrodipicolinate synthase